MPEISTSLDHQTRIRTLVGRYSKQIKDTDDPLDAYLALLVLAACVARSAGVTRASFFGGVLAAWIDSYDPSMGDTGEPST